MRDALAFRVFAPMVQLAMRFPIGRRTLAGFFIRLAANDYITPSIYGPILKTRWHDATFRFCVFGSYGCYFSDFLRRYSEQFSFIDIGANVGLYSLIAARNPKCAACYAFEPNPEVFASLQQNVELNCEPKIRCNNAAVSDTEGQLRFSVVRDHSGSGRILAQGEVVVRTVNRRTLDEIAETDKHSKIVKIDVEGHEPTVIAELLNSDIRSSIKNIFFEVDEDRYDVVPVIAALKSNDFVPTFKNGERPHYDLMFERRVR